MNNKYKLIQENIQYTIKSKHEFEKTSSDGTLEKTFSVKNDDKEYKIKLEKDNSEYCLTLLKYEPKDEAWHVIKKINYGDKELAEKKFEAYKEVFGKKVVQTTTQNKVVVQEKIMNKKFTQVQESVIVHELLGMGRIPIADDLIGLVTGTVDSVTSNLAKSIKGIHNTIIDEPANSPAVEAAKQQIAEKSGLMKFLEANKTNAIVAGGIVGGGLLAAGGIKLYKNFFSQNAKLCANSPNKEECMKDLKINSIKKSIAVLGQAKGKYNALPEQYKNQAIARIDKQIGVMNNKINMIAVNKGI